MLRAVALRGSLPRGAALEGSRLGARVARYVMSDLLKEGLLVSETPKGPVRLGLPVHAVPYLLPGLYPEGVAFEANPAEVR